MILSWQDIVYPVVCTQCTAWELLNPQGTHILQIYWIYKDAIALTSRWKVLDKLFFQNEVQKVLYKLMLVTYSLDYSPRVYSPLKGFKFHAQPQTGAYSCSMYLCTVP